MISPDKSNRKETKNQKQLSISYGASHDKKYPYLSDISQLLHNMSTLELQNLCTLQEILFAKSYWEATNYSGSLEKCKKRLSELYGEDWEDHVKLKDHFKSLKHYYIWVLLISHKQQWNEIKK